MTVSQPAPGVVIIGAGHAGASVAGFLRQYGYEDQITLIGDEPHLPYQRPPLSKAWLKGKADTESTALRPLDYYISNGIDLRCGVAAINIDTNSKFVELSDGVSLAYEHLVIATGSRAIIPQISGTNLAGVRCLRSATDADALKADLVPGKHIAIVGGGYIGLEVAASAIALCAKATVVERESRLLARSSSTLLAQFFADFQRGHGISVMLDTTVSEFVGEAGRLSAIRLSNGEAIDCDLALLGVGAMPNMELAKSAGLLCNQGIIVDHDSRTSDPAIFAIGDVAARPLAIYGRTMRLESVANALEQAKQAASAIVGRERPSPEVTWNWSDQFDLKFQVAGMPFDVEQTVVRGDVSTCQFAIFHLNKAGAIQQVEAVNSPGEFMLGKKLIASRKPVAPDRIVDLGVDLKQLIA